jgi:hypothetical protein
MFFSQMIIKSFPPFFFFSILTSSLLFPSNTDTILKMERTINPPIIDGKVIEKEWDNAPSIDNFIQFQPDKGQRTSVKTIVKVLYDSNFIYFGFICYDPNPKKVVFGSNRRDGLDSASGTDSVTVVIDTFNDSRSAYYFRTNVKGIQHDGHSTENGRVNDTNWDCIWQSAGSWEENGWSVEMAIPFKQIKYLPGENRTWGVQFSRYFPRRLEKSFWPDPKEDYRRLSSKGKLVDLDLGKNFQNYKIIPHLRSQFQEKKKSQYNPGLDASYSFSQGISGHLTINPDFATVEADRERVNLTRFELNLPEKRNFFLEGNDIFQQPIRLFYSRRIADIYGGAKLYGKTGKYEFMTLSNQTKPEDNLIDSSNFSVVRLKRDILESSNIGLLLANKLTKGKSQGTMGLDLIHYFSERFNLTGQFALSYRAGKKSDSAFYVSPSYNTRTFHINFYYKYLGDYFGDNANEVGFIRDDNRHELDSHIQKIFWVSKGFFERITYNSNYNIYWGMDRTLRSWDVLQSISTDFRNKFSFRFSHEKDYKLYEKEYRNNQTSLEIGHNMRQWESCSIGYTFGKNFDSDFHLIEGKVKRNISSNLAVEYNITRLTKSPDPQNQSTWIHIIVVNQYFTKDLYMKFFYQINSVLSKHNIETIFVYRFQPPFGLMQLAYQKGKGEFGEPGIQDNTLFLKVSYVF